MKTIRLLIILLITCIHYNCSDEEDSLKKFISIDAEMSDNELIIPPGRLSETTVITSDVAWTLEGGADWCSYEPKSGGAGTTIVNFTLEPNMEYDDRSVNITLSAGGKQQVLTVYQKKKDAIILSRDKFDNIGMEGDEITVDLQTNIEYRVEIPAKSATWISMLPEQRSSGLARGLENKSMSFKIGATQDESARVGEIIFMSATDEKLRDTVFVYQVQRDVIVLSRAEHVVPLEGQTLKIDLRSNVIYDVEIPQEVDWVHIDPGLGRSSKVDRLLLKVDEYTEGETRNCVVTVRDRNNSSLFTELKIRQIDREIIVIEDSEHVIDRVLTAPREEAVYTLNISDNISGHYELVIPNHAKWIQPVPVTFGLASGSMQIRLTENPIDQTQRMAKIFVRGIDDPNTIDTLTVIQAGGIEADLDERRIIYEIALALDYEKWPNAYKTAWSLEKPIEEWSNGIKVRDGKVVELIFPSDGNGQISPKIGELTHLETLGFGGTFTTAGCKVTGPIPPEIGKLRNLKKLMLKGEFTEFPIELGALENLEDLTLNFAFYDPLDVIGDLVNLKKLSVTTGFAGPMSENWGKLTKLESLTLSTTNFTSVAPIEHMTSLKTLSLSYCQKVQGALPGGVGYLTALESLSISNCSFSDLCPSMGSLVNLKTLRITDNNLSFIPEDIGGCRSLTTLNMSKNNISGSIPESIGKLQSVTSLDLSTNLLSGNIPATIGDMSKVTTINLSNNQLTGTIPSSVSRLTAVTSFNLSNNKLTGLCEELGNMYALKTLNLSNNRIEGTIPSLGKLTALTTVNMSRNLLSGRIPMDWNKNMAALTTVQFTNNKLEGEIPSTFGLLPKLSTLSLDTNRLEGNIPSALFKSTTLRNLYLQANLLSGELSVDFSNLLLSNLDLRDNNFEGSIPEKILGQSKSFASKNSILHLSGNRLTGTIPNELWSRMKTYPNWQIREQQNGVVLAPPPGEN